MRNVTFNSLLSSKTYSPLLSGLIGYWNFDEETGNYVDKVNSNALYASSVVQGGSGIIGNAVGFDTATDYLSINYNESLDWGTTDSYTVSFWAYLNNTPATAGRYFHIFRFSVSSGVAYALTMSMPTDGVYLRVQQYDTSNVRTDIESRYGKYTANAWVHFLVYKNSTTTRIYINGTDFTSGTPSTPNQLKQFNQTLFIGNYGSSNSGSIDGKLDEFCYWNRALTTDEIATLYNDGYGRTYPFN